MKIGLSYDQGTPKYRLYVEALLAAADAYGFEVEPLWLASTDRAMEQLTLDEIDGLLLTGGADVDPARYGRPDATPLCAPHAGRDAAELLILDHALERKLPMLAICRGMQLLNVACGGSLVPNIETGVAHQLDDRERHDVEFDLGTALRALLGAGGRATSSHHQAVARLGEGLRVAARHADGTIEAIEWMSPEDRPWLMAVQWHPERMDLSEPLSGPVFRAFLEAAAARRR